MFYISHLIKSPEETLQEIDQLKVWQDLLGPVQLGQNIRSPFRIDNHPNCYLEEYQGHIMLVDWKNIKRNTNIIQAVQHFKNCSYLEALKYIHQGFRLPAYIKPLNSEKKKDDFEFKLEFKYKDYTKWDVQYWKNLGITVEQLRHEHIKSIQYYYCNSRTHPNQLKQYKAKRLAFGITINGRRKLYQPFQPVKKGKFYSSLNQYDIGGKWDKDNDTLGIVTSFKDYMVCKYHNPYNYSFVPNECVSLNTFFLNTIRSEFNSIFILGDNDDPGKTFNNRLVNQIGSKSFSFVLPKWNDPAQFYFEEKNINVIEKIVEDEKSRRIKSL